jgi:cell division protein YceG involved in septum cleavage
MEREIKKQNILFRLIKLIIWIVLLLSVIFYYKYTTFKTDILVVENKIIEIKSGETEKDLAKKLNINYYFLKQYLKDKEFTLLK